HFIGIGGIGMSGIAQLCLKKGSTVSGSDINESDNTRNLVNLGARIYVGHSGENVANKDLVVYSSAITPANCEFQEALKHNIPIVRRAEFLASLMDNQTVVAVTGAHGKTTTSSLTAHLLTQAGLVPTVAVGGIVGNISNNAALGLGKYFIAEADESDGTFLLYKPHYSIITNVDQEHLDFYKTFERIKGAFGEFVAHTDRGGCVFWCSDDKELNNIMKKYPGVRNISFGLNREADIHPTNVKLNSFSSQFNVFCKNKLIGKFELSLPGMHNISNSLSAIGLGLELNIKIDLIKDALKSFLGARRRFQLKYEDDDLMVIDDYAHHPTEIRATIKAAKNVGRKRIIAVFQPHRYSRTKFLLEQFSRSFVDADELFITDIYAAGEEKIDGINARNLYNLIKDLGRPRTKFTDKNNLGREVLNFSQKGDLILFLGAGDITKICDEVVSEIKRKVKV
ncbi:MAG: UDP-N-acetylmuramate--L-alanine ligase, partial [Candidatus Omnitrophica bacterium]|nr:UDP-N-acetylmuramate--L-alanine ligase [Candidatus Omnitrophota bacterium]